MTDDTGLTSDFEGKPDVWVAAYTAMLTAKYSQLEEVKRTLSSHPGGLDIMTYRVVPGTILKDDPIHDQP
jgi:hypothetical protein